MTESTNRISNANSMEPTPVKQSRKRFLAAITIPATTTAVGATAEFISDNNAGAIKFIVIGGAVVGAAFGLQRISENRMNHSPEPVINQSTVENNEMNVLGKMLFKAGVWVGGIGAGGLALESMAHVDTTSGKIVAGLGAAALAVGGAVRGMSRLPD